MRLSLALLVVLAACGDDGGSELIDAAVDAQSGDAANDAPVVADAALDAFTGDASMDITTACTNACTKLGTCFGETEPADLEECVGECSLDLMDCTPAQVMDVDACSQEACTGPDEEQWAITMCIANVACVDM